MSDNIKLLEVLEFTHWIHSEIIGWLSSILRPKNRTRSKFACVVVHMMQALWMYRMYGQADPNLDEVRVININKTKHVLRHVKGINAIIQHGSLYYIRHDQNKIISLSALFCWNESWLKPLTLDAVFFKTHKSCMGSRKPSLQKLFAKLTIQFPWFHSTSFFSTCALIVLQRVKKTSFSIIWLIVVLQKGTSSGFASSFFVLSVASHTSRAETWALWDTFPTSHILLGPSSSRRRHTCWAGEYRAPESFYAAPQLEWSCSAHPRTPLSKHW